MRFDRITVCLAAAALAVTVAACGSSSSDTTGSGATSDTTTATTAASGSGLPDLSGQSLTFVSFGGDLQTAEQEAWTDPFAEATGATVNQAGPSDYAKLQVQVESGNVQWDAMEADSFFVGSNCGTLFEERPASVDMSKIEPQFIDNNCGVPAAGFSIMMMYDKHQFGDDPPTSWADFFDTQKYPGKRGIWNFAQSGAFEAALMADGVAPEDLYPLDIDRAVAKLDTIKDDIVFAADPAGLTEQLVSKSVAMSLIFNARAYAAVEVGAGEDYAPNWNQNIRGWDNIAVPKGAPNAEAAFALLDYIATPEAQTALASIFPYSPLTKGGKIEADPVELSYQANDPSNAAKAVSLDESYWGEHYDELNAAWTAFASG